jgi:DNA-binding CsgD family transcriptional regulator
MNNHDPVGELACVATRCLSANEFHREALAWIDRTIGIDGANLVEIDGPRVTVSQTLGIDQAWTDRFHREIGQFGADLRSLMDMALAHGGAMRGQWSSLERWAALAGRQGFEESMAFPIGVRTGSVVVLKLAGVERGVLFLGRGGRARLFSREEGNLLTRIAPILALGSAVHARPPAPPSEPRAPRRAGRSEPITARERAVVEFAALGLGNREIGLALGVSRNTIRNQLVGIFNKLGVGSRAEMVAVALKEGLVSQ